MSNPYIIFVGHSADNMQPHKSAPDQETAINIAMELRDIYPCVEATFMPEDDLDTNDIVYSYYK